MSAIVQIDRAHPIGVQLLQAAIAMQEAFATFRQFERIRAESIAVNAAAVTALMGITAEPQAFSDRMGAVNAGSGTQAALQEFVDLIVAAPAIPASA